MDKAPPSTLPPTVSLRGQLPAGSLTEQLAQDAQREMLSAWQAGARILAETWLDRHPEVKARPEIAVLIIYEELCLREERGEQVDSAEFYERFPQYRDALSVVLSCHRLMHEEPSQFPTAGEDFGEFRLLRELGRGARGRVFLATQPALSDRPLVVKLTPRTGDEHLSLARLQHTAIVPLFLVQEFPERNLRALCMPFLGGTSWAAILQALTAGSGGQPSGARIVAALQAAAHDLGLAATTVGAALAFLAQASYEQAICWIGSCLADGLHHAHQRGLLHLDVKPSNVLLAGDGQPMLLDFHLAHEVDAALAGDLDRVGGTPGYMSPEQDRAVQAMRSGRPVVAALDRRSDIYSLGILVYESLTGQRPPADEKQVRELLRSARPTVSRSVQDVLHRCLAGRREARYADAGELAADLRRHLANRPLRGVANRNLPERWQKWRRRKPHGVAVWTIALVALALVGGAGAVFYADRSQAARTALRQAEQDLADGDHAGALERLTTGLQAIRWLPGRQELRESFQTQLAAVQRARAWGALHELVEQLRFLDSVPAIPAAKLRELAAGCRTIWNLRTQIAGSASDAATQQANAEKTDLVDLALLWTRLATRSPTEDEQPMSNAEALEVLAQAEALWGPSPALVLARGQLRGEWASGEQLAALAARLKPHSAWECDAIGRSLLAAGEWDRARERFQQAAELEPNAFWPYFHLALVDYRLEQFADALRAASVCVALSPRRAECFFNRGLCYDAVGQTFAAHDDFSRAIELDPRQGAAYLQRGLLLARIDQPHEALADLRRAAELGSEPARAYSEMAQIRIDEHQSDEARRCVTEALARDPQYAPALALDRLLRAESPRESKAGQ